VNEFLRGRALPRDQRVAAGRRLGLGAESGKPGSDPMDTVLAPYTTGAG
jgi:hypothetical protein